MFAAKRLPAGLSAAVFAAALSCCATCPTNVAAEVRKVTVFRSGTDGYDTYRIPAIVRTENGQRQCRDQNGSDPATRAVATSSDGGLTYEAPFVAEPQFITPVVQNAVLRFATDRGDARNILVHSGPGHATSRRDLTILVSFDEGKSWNNKTLLHAGSAAYSDLVKLNAHELGVLYEAGQSLYEEILYAKVELDDLGAEPRHVQSDSMGTIRRGE